CPTGKSGDQAPQYFQEVASLGRDQGSAQQRKPVSSSAASRFDTQSMSHARSPPLGSSGGLLLKAPPRTRQPASGLSSTQASSHSRALPFIPNRPGKPPSHDAGSRTGVDARVP